MRRQTRQQTIIHHRLASFQHAADLARHSSHLAIIDARSDFAAPRGQREEVLADDDTACRRLKGPNSERAPSRDETSKKNLSDERLAPDRSHATQLHG